MLKKSYDNIFIIPVYILANLKINFKIRWVIIDVLCALFSAKKKSVNNYNWKRNDLFRQDLSLMLIDKRRKQMLNVGI